MERSSKEFKSLKSTWYKKLRKSGFKDIEKKVKGKDEYRLKEWTQSRRINIGDTDSTLLEAKQTYYRLAGFFLHEHEFASLLDQRIWELHAEGLSSREIAKTLRSRTVKLNKDNVGAKIRLLTIEMYGRYHGLDAQE